MTVSIAANATDQRIQTFLLVQLDLPSGAVYWTNCDMPLTTAAPTRTDQAPAATWTQRPLRLSAVTSQQGSISGAQLDLGNADLVMSVALFGATNPIGVGVHVWEGWFDPANTGAIPDDSTQLEEGRIDQLRIKTGTTDIATIVIGPAVDFATRVFPRRRMTQKCSFLFKGPACQSTGTDTVCDGTLTSCSLTTKRSGGPVGGNRDNFGGFPSLPAMGL